MGVVGSLAPSRVLSRASVSRRCSRLGVRFGPGACPRESALHSASFMTPLAIVRTPTLIAHWLGILVFHVVVAKRTFVERRSQVLIPTTVVVSTVLLLYCKK